MKKISLSLLFIVLISAAFAQTKTVNDVKDYLGISGPISFEKNNYELSWSSHPVPSLYKQEYLPKNENADKYNSMILIDLTIGDFTIENILKAKVSELEKLKKTNPVINYNVIENTATGEYILDFLISANSPDGKSIDIVERNVYRYKAYIGKTGQKGVLLFGVSKRSYGNDITGFFKKLKSNLNDLINAVGKVSIPDVDLISQQQ